MQILNESPSSLGAPIFFVAELPGPRTGQTLVNEVLLTELRKDHLVRVFNTGGKAGTIPTLRTKAIHWSKYLFVGLAAIFWRLRGVKTLYTSLHSTAGIWLDLYLVVIAKLFGYRCILHHHTYPYVLQHDWRMATIQRLIAPTGLHVVPCAQFETAFAGKYSGPSRFLILNPSVVRHRELSIERTPHDGFVLGHLSNLSVAKGLPIVLDTFAQLISRGQDVRLVLAGPCHSRVENDLIHAAMVQYGERVTWLGPIYEMAKVNFYRSIDLFLFPTQYIKEVWGIVLTEALTAGVPCVAYGRACIPSLIGNNAGLVVDIQENFSELAVPFVEQMIANQDHYYLLTLAAKRRGEELAQEAFDAVSQLRHQIG